MQKEKTNYLSVTIQSVLLGLGFYFLLRIPRNNWYFPLIDSLFSADPAIHQILQYLGHLFFFIGLFAYFYIVKEDRHCLKSAKFKAKDLLFLLIGLLGGFLYNGSNILLAYLHEDIDMVSCEFDPGLLVISLFAVLIQSSAEEFQYRLWLQKRISAKAPFAYAVIGSGIAFGLSHMMNNGITFFALANLIFWGMIVSLLFEITDSIWLVCGIHTGWNFTQNFIFGLPNSGFPAVLTVMGPTFTKKSFFYDPTFGVEGTISGFIINVIILVITYLIYKKKTNTNQVVQ